ncbi:hypothetical protein COU60_03230 [Candidatus Pacearchaeota archaeon CG10_big_fil_rev_8_21_14_0_10_34_76]|nr:MAG: hypothetical protein COU60_03230 [Candidatus Pacearchaeota archaeon CG10_big_fil_rev_8_21_14_0_10_34_76]
MKIEVNISKRYAFMILGAILLVGGIFMVNAITPNPGHDASSVGPGTFSGISSDTWSFPGGVNAKNISVEDICIGEGLGYDCMTRVPKRSYLEHGSNYYDFNSIDLTTGSQLDVQLDIGNAYNSFCALQQMQIWGDDSQPVGCQIYSPDGDWQTGEIYLHAYRGNINQKVFCAANCIRNMPPIGVG